MNISEPTILLLTALATGDSGLTPYQRGRDLVAMFNRLGFRKDGYQHSRGFIAPDVQEKASRNSYAEIRIRSMNGTSKIADLIQYLLNPSRFVDEEMQPIDAITHLNNELAYDGYKVSLYGSIITIISEESPLVPIEEESFIPDDDYQGKLDEQIEKCERKLREGDLEGAITNAKTMVETLFNALAENKGFQVKGRAGDDLPKFSHEVMNQLGLSVSDSRMNTGLQQMLQGVRSIINGLSTVRNVASDGHDTEHEPTVAEATLAVNIARTLAVYLSQYFD